MKLKELQKHWEEHGKRDPLWAVLTESGKEGNKWDPDEFFSIGERWLTRTFKDIPPRFRRNLPRNTALDFGCGVGRLSRALSNRFDQVTGVDIASSMIKEARSYNKDIDNLEFKLNTKNDLKIFEKETFDMVLTVITLQHMHPRYAKKYIVEFLRVLKPGGLLVFQIPSRPDAYSRKVSRFVPRNLLFRTFENQSGPIMEMHWIHISKMIRFLEAKGGEIIRITADNFAGKDWTSFTYMVTKPQ